MQLVVKKRCFAFRIATLQLAAVVPFAACAPPAASGPAPPSVETTTCGGDGALRTTLIGGINTDIDWTAADMRCDSMQRPDGEGIRLRYSGDVGDENLALIIAMPALRPGRSGQEVPSNITISVEGSGRFFSSPDLETCWTEIAKQELIDDGDSGDNGSYAIAGTLYCIAPLGELNGDAAVTIPELFFASIIDWSAR